MVREARLEAAEKEAEKVWNEFYGEADEEPKEVKLDEEGVEPPEEVQEEEPNAGQVNEPPEEKPVDWEQKYRTLEGKYKAEVPRLSQEIRQQKETLERYQSKVSSLQEQLNAIPAAAGTVFTEDDIGRLESDYPGMGDIIKTLDEKYKDRIEQLEQRLKDNTTSLVEDVRADTLEARKRQFDNDMRSYGVPDWKTIDYDERFAAWLQKPITPYSDMTRADVLTYHAGRFEADKVSKMFLDFKAEISGDADASQKKLEQYVAPPNTNVARREQRGGASGYTRESYTQFMRETAKGKFTPSKWGGKTEEQVEAIFDDLIIKGKLM